MIDTQAVRAKWLNQCGYCDAGLAMDCSCTLDDPRHVILELVREVENQRERASFLADREHIVGIRADRMDDLREWMQSPNGGHPVGRVTFESVEGGGIWVRTRPYRLDRNVS